MKIEQARELAAQIWCKPEHGHCVMDVDFAESIAQLLVKHTSDVHPTQSRREEMRKIAQEIAQADLMEGDLCDRVFRTLMDVTSVKSSRRHIAEAFEADPTFRDTYVANASVNIAAAAQRRLAGPECDALASQIVKLFFEEDK